MRPWPGRFSPDRSEDEDERLLKEEVLGVIPATAIVDKDTPLTCGLVFATNIIIVALLGKIAQIAGAFYTPDYNLMKNAWAGYEHKPTASILDKYRSYIIPYSAITTVELIGTGRIFKKSTLHIHTSEQTYTFRFGTSHETVGKDIDHLLRQAGTRYSKEGTT